MLVLNGIIRISYIIKDMESNCNKIYLGSSSIETAISPGSRKAVTAIYLWSQLYMLE